MRSPICALRLYDAELWLRPWLFGAGGGRYGKARLRRRFQGRVHRRRPGDPAQVVAACDRIRSTLKWRPRFNDLETIASHASGMGAQAFETHRLTASPPGSLENLRSLHCDGLGEVARLIHVRAHHDRRMVGAINFTGMAYTSGVTAAGTAGSVSLESESMCTSLAPWGSVIRMILP
jgi:hypothetical protein